MPNWCNNVVHISHTDPAMIARLEASAESGILQEFIPVPLCLRDTVAGRVGEAGSPEQLALEASQQDNLNNHNYKDWYDFCVNEWGTKWDLCEVSVDTVNETKLTLSFDTAWSPPIGAYEKLMELGFEIEAFYYEPGMQFAGIWEDGCDDFYESWGNADGAESMLPKTLDEMFCISEGQREWDEEEESVDDSAE